MTRSHRTTGRAIMVGAAALTIALTVVGCGSSASGGSSSSITELDYYTDAAGSAAWQKVLNDCTAQTGIKVNRQSVPTDQLTQKILQGATSRTLPDLAFTDNPTLQEIAATGALTPLTDYGIGTDGYYPSIVKAGTYQGKVYGLAPGVNGLALIYNKDLLQAAGVTPPSTWDELKTDAAKLTKGSTYGLAFSAANSEEGTWQFLPFFWSNGADLSQLDSPQAVRRAVVRRRPGLLGLGVEVGGELEPERRHRPVHLGQRRHDGQRLVDAARAGPEQQPALRRGVATDRRRRAARRWWRWAVRSA